MKTYKSLANPQYERQPFTDFSQVDPDTDLSRLNFNWRERDLPERQRTKHVHRLHPYLGKFIPQLVEIFLRKYAKGTVCDPFAGSGTTLVEASTLGFDAIGVDLTAFNCLLCKVKTDTYDLRALELEVRNILYEFGMSNRWRLGASAVHAEITAEMQSVSPYLKDWLHPTSLRELLLFRRLIKNRRYTDLYQVVLCRAARSARLAPHHELDFPKQPVTRPYKCRKHKRVCRPTQGAAKFVNRYLWDTLQRIKMYSALRKDVEVRVYNDDSRALKLPPFDTIVTSPPYVGLIDYHEQHRYAYELLGLQRKDELEIGPASAGNSETARDNYRKAIARVFRNCSESMKDGDIAVIVIGDRRGLYSDMHDECGFRLSERFERHVNRRTGRRNSDFFESILVWEKS